MARGKSRARKGGKARAKRSSHTSAPVPVPPPEEEGEAPPVAALRDEDLDLIFLRLDPVDLFRAALACRRWRRAASRAAALPRAPPLLGYFFHPSANLPPPLPADDPIHRPAVFAPVDLYAPRLSLRLAPGAATGLSIRDVHLGLVVLLPVEDGPEITALPRVLVVDPASRRRELLPPPPRAVIRGDAWRCERRVLGVAVLSRAHGCGTRLSFEAVCVTLDGDRPRAWVANVRDGDCTWRVLPRSKDVKVNFEPDSFDDSCVRAAGNIYWHIEDEDRLLVLDPRTLKFSFLLVPEDIGEHCRVGETPDDGKLCIVTAAEDQELQIWVRAEEDVERSDNGWVLKKEVCLREALDTVPRLPKGRLRMELTWVTDMDYARTGKVFITTWGFGRYAFHMETGQLDNLETHDRLQRGNPIWAYTLPWPPAFLAQQDPLSGW